MEAPEFSIIVEEIYSPTVVVSRRFKNIDELEGYLTKQKLKIISFIQCGELAFCVISKDNFEIEKII